jgi:hypothetical protein
MTGTRSFTVLALLAVTFTAAALLRAEERMRAGLWEVTSTTDGKPSGTLGSTCYTAAMVELANTPAKMLREATAMTSTKRGCTLKDFKMDGNKISMTQVCGARTAVITSTYSGDTFDTVGTSTEAGVTTVIHMKGRRTGECK